MNLPFGLWLDFQVLGVGVLIATCGVVLICLDVDLDRRGRR